MAQITAQNGDGIIGPDTVANWITIILNADVDANGNMEVLIQVPVATTGIKFCVRPVGTNTMIANAYAFPAGSKFIMTFKPGVQQIVYQCSNAADTFVISV